ncbi:MAG TPA: NADPH-dependent F420 reductase [Solirubrobacteraceae bacterium]|nr:NADPH-dependent F420 reductase [Solirubrobacteraceae bacterium]
MPSPSPASPSHRPGTGQVDPVAVIGASGALGFGLALRLARTGVPIAIGSRDAARAAETAERAHALVPDGAFTAHDNAEAARAAGEEGIVILSVPFRNQSETLANLKGALSSGQLLIDATVPLAAAVSGKATRMLGVWQGSAAQQALEMVPDGVHVVSALHTVSAASLADLEHPLEQDVLVCGDARPDKRRAAELIERIDGLRCVDCGKLEMSRTTEALTALLISVNARYKAHAGVRLTNLPEQLWQ